MLKLIIAFLGIPTGMLLGYIAKEEIVLGKKYLQYCKYILSLCLIVFVEWYLVQYQQWSLLSISILIWILLLILSRKWKWQIIEIPFYLLFTSFFFLLPEQSTLIASLIFLYGLPVGSLVWQEHENNQKRP